MKMWDPFTPSHRSKTTPCVLSLANNHQHLACPEHQKGQRLIVTATYVSGSSVTECLGEPCCTPHPVTSTPFINISRDGQSLHMTQLDAD